MPLTPKGTKIMGSLHAEYGDKKGTSVFYAMRNMGKIKNVDPESSPKPPRRKVRFPHPTKVKNK